MTRYQHLATLLAERIEQGLYRHGEKLPSVRSLSQEHGVSISTVQQAYQLLEQQQMIVPQPRSGYFVAPRKAQPPVPPMSRPVQRPVEITQWDQVLTMLDARYDKSIIPFGGGSPDVTQPSLKPIWRELSRAIQHNLTEVLNYDELAGRRELREQIARLMLDGGSVVTADDLVLTSGCHSALSLALLSVCQPGDIIAVESPCYYGTMQMLRGLGLKTIEIPTDPETGISIEALELALEYPRPRTIHSWDIDGRVMLCSSFTKTIAPGLRIGWIAPGRYYDKLLQMKYAASGTNVPSTQLAACNFIREGHYHRHVRRMRQIYQRNIEIYTCWLREFFPCGICVTRPKGGFMLWVELPEQVDMVCVAKQLCRLKIQVAPGSLFSAAGKYRNCVRINCALPPTEKHKAVMLKLGEAVKVAME